MIDSKQILSTIPTALRDPLIKSYQQIISNYSEHRWEPAELNGGKFCEIVYSIIHGYVSGTYPAKPSKPANMLVACQALEKIPADSKRIGDRSVRVLIPRMLPVLYEIRNNRGVGHAGGDVDPNLLDATAIYSMTSWVLAELVRIFHNVTTTEAQQVVNTIVERKSPLLWEIDGIQRVLDTSLSFTQQVLVILYGTTEWKSEADLLRSTEYKNSSLFRSKILQPLHKKRYIEYDVQKKRAKISPTGIKHVEENILTQKK